MTDRVRIVSMGLVGVLALVTLAACGNDDAKIVQEDVTRIVVAGAPTELPTPDPVALAATAAANLAGDGDDSGASPVADGNEITLEAWDIGWRTEGQEGPEVQLTVAPGAVINLVNTGVSAHNFEAPDFSINEDMPVGYTGSVTIPADAAPGAYDFICNIPGHAAGGMVGTITVDPSAAAPPPVEGGAPPADGGEASGGDPGAVAQAIELEAWDIGWSTADQPGPEVHLTLAPGTVINLVNTGVSVHNFEAPDFNIDEDMPVSYTGSVTIPADAAPGTYDFICNVPGHAAGGMHGTITIE